VLELHAIRDLGLAWLRNVGPRRVLQGLAVAAALAAILFALNILQRLVPLFWASDFRSLFYEDLGFSESESEILGLIAAFVWSAIWAPLIVWTLSNTFWTFNLRKFALGLIGTLIIYGNVPLLHYLLGKDICFNQRTGQPVKWYVVEPGGGIVLYDSTGFDKNGIAKRPVTSDICRFRDRMAKGIKPSRITDDPRAIEFFDGASGTARVWYHRLPNGEIELFNNEGLHPALGEPLSPMTKAVAMEVRSAADRAQAAARERDERKANEQKLAAIAAAEREAVDAKERQRRAVAAIFGTASYAEDVVVLGATPKQADEASDTATKVAVAAVFKELGSKDRHVDELRPGVYTNGYFDKLFAGNTDSLVESGLAAKMRSALLIKPNAVCKASTATNTVSCTVTIDVRIVMRDGVVRSRQWTAVGAGLTTNQAAQRAVELVVERNPTWLDGI
jgi:hypothetical protein